MTSTAPSIGTPAPGIHIGMPAAAYHALPGASASRLNKLARSPAHLRHSMDKPGEPTPAMVLGTAAHTLILEPDQFATTYTTAGQCEATTGKGARCTNSGTVYLDRWLCGAHCKGIGPAAGGKIILTQDQFDRAHGIAAAVKAHPAASRLLGARTGTELSSIWIDRATGVTCKMRADCPTTFDGAPVIADLKTTSDAGPDSFARTIHSFGYHRAAAHYLRGLSEHGEVFERFYHIAAETDAPHAVAVYRLTDEALTIGDDEVRGLLVTYRTCEESGLWPAYGDEPIDIGLPYWATRKIERMA